MRPATLSAIAAAAVTTVLLAPPAYATVAPAATSTVVAQSEEPGLVVPAEEFSPTEPTAAEKRWSLVAAAVLAVMGGTLAVSMLRGGRLGDRWYYGRSSRTTRGKQGRPVEPTDNVRSREW